MCIRDRTGEWWMLQDGNNKWSWCQNDNTKNEKQKRDKNGNRSMHKQFCQLPNFSHRCFLPLEVDAIFRRFSNFVIKCRLAMEAHLFIWQQESTYCAPSRKWKITFCCVYSLSLSLALTQPTPPVFLRCQVSAVCIASLRLSRVSKLKMTCRIAASRTNNIRKPTLHTGRTQHCRRHRKTAAGVSKHTLTGIRVRNKLKANNERYGK